MGMVFLLREKACVSGSLYSEGELFREIKSDRVLRQVRPRDLTWHAGREYYD